MNNDQLAQELKNIYRNTSDFSKKVMRNIIRKGTDNERAGRIIDELAGIQDTGDEKRKLKN